MLHLPPQIEAKIEELLATGRFHGPEDVLDHALRALQAEAAQQIPVAGVFGGMKGTGCIHGDIIAPVEDWFEHGRIA